MNLVTSAVFVLLATLIQPSTLQSLPDPGRCVRGSGVTAFPGCKYRYDYFSTCSAYAAASSASEYYNCVCDQSYLNAIYDCASEQRLCLGTGDPIDLYFSQGLSLWHSQCDDKINYTPTTPVLSSITASYAVSYCNTVRTNCAALTAERNDCVLSHEFGPSSSLTSCLCQPALLSLAFDCSVLGNVSCVQVPAHLTQMAEYSHCSNLNDVLTIPADLTSSLGSETTIRFTFFTPSSTTIVSSSTITTSPTTPTPIVIRTTSDGSVPSTTSSNGAQRILGSYMQNMIPLLLVLWTVVT